MSKRNHWYDYLWVLTALYLALGFFNILFAWLGLLCFFIPLIMASTFGTKSYCNKYCGRGQLFELIGNSWKLSPKRDIPSWLRSHTFRYGFLLFFTAMFVNMLVSTYLVFTHAIYFHQTVSLLWTFDVPWHWAYSGGTQPWVAQFAFGFYQHHADLQHSRHHHAAAVQAAFLVRLLPYGHDNAAPSAAGSIGNKF